MLSVECCVLNDSRFATMLNDECGINSSLIIAKGDHSTFHIHHSTFLFWQHDHLCTIA